MTQFDALTKVVVERFVEKQVLAHPFIPGIFYFQADTFATNSPYHLTGSVSETKPESAALATLTNAMIRHC